MTYSIDIIFQFNPMTVEYSCQSFDEQEMRVWVQTHYPQAEIQNWKQVS